MRRLDARGLLLFCGVVALVSACASSAPVKKNAEIPKGSEIVVISLRDCVISGQDEDCNGSGRKGGEAFQEVFSQGGKFTSKLVDRPVGAKEAFSDQAAAEFARAKGYNYVLSGEVDDFYSVAAMTFRPDRAAVSIRIIRASDGLVITSYSQPGRAASNFSTPKGMIKGLAKIVRDGL
jgi:hypothetical protein